MSTPKAVFDTVILLQAFCNPSGPAAACWSRVVDHRMVHLASAVILAELEEVTSRPKLMSRLGYSSEDQIAFMETVRLHSEVKLGVRHWFNYPRDPKDEPYLDLAIEADAQFLVTWDNDLLDLMKPDSADGRIFRAQAPGLKIVTPPELLALLQASPRE